MTGPRYGPDGPPAGWRSPRLRAAAGLWLTLAAAQVALAFAQGRPDDGDELPAIYDWSLGLQTIVAYGFLIVLTLGIAGLDPAGRATALGLVAFRPGAIRLAIGTVVVALVVGAVLEPILHAGEEQGLAPQEWEPGRAGPLIFNSVIICSLVPFTEELFFRGLGVRVLGILGVVPAVVATGLFFGFAHGLLVALPPLVVFGIGLAWVRARTGSVWPGVIAHALYNALGITVSLLA